MSDGKMTGLAAGMLLGAAAAAGFCLTCQDKRKMRRMAHKMACGCEQAVEDAERFLCRCMK